jgi:glycosyltransferase involved in cell wall biosynthesis
MKVLFLCPRFDHTAGDGRYATRLASDLGLLGVEVFVLTLREERHVLVGPNNQCRDLGPADLDLLRRNYYSRAARSALASVLDEVRPDLVHVHGIHQSFTLSCLLELKRRSVPLTLTVHDYKIVCGNAGLFSDVTEQPCLRCLDGEHLAPIRTRCKRGSLLQSIATAAQMRMWELANGLEAFASFLVASPFLVPLLERKSALRGKVHVLRFPRPDVTASSRDASASPSVAFVGRLVALKGPTIFAEAVQGLDVPIHVFGAGPQEARTKTILAGDRDVTFHGWVDQRELAHTLGPGCIVVLPYLALETFGLAVAESMALGCCVVTTDRGAIPDLVQDGVNGRVLSGHASAAEFKAAIAELLSDPSRAIAMGNRARETISGLPDGRAHACDVREHYRALVGGSQ